MAGRKYTTRPPTSSRTRRPILDVGGGSYRGTGWTPGMGPPSPRGGRLPGRFPGAGQTFQAPTRWSGTGRSTSSLLRHGYSATRSRGADRGRRSVGFQSRNPVPRRPNRQDR